MNRRPPRPKRGALTGLRYAPSEKSIMLTNTKRQGDFIILPPQIPRASHISLLDTLMFPILYHAHHKRYQEDLPFWLELAARQGDPVLEMGCGSGRVLGPMAEAGYDMYGLDNDPGMLAVLNENLSPGLVGQTHIFAGDFTSFCLSLRFPLIILPCNTYSTLSTGGRQATLERAHQHLRAPRRCPCRYRVSHP